MPPPPPERPAPRPYQQEADAAIQAELARAHRRTLVILPTGSGKTIVMAMQVARFGLPFLLLAGREELIDQNYRAVKQFAPPRALIGIEQGSRHIRGDEQIVLASIPTLAMSADRLRRLQARRFTVCLVDETHHATASSWQKVLTALRCFDPAGPPLIGFTATPRRGDGVGLHTLFQSIAYQKSLRDMVAEKWLAPLRAFSVKSRTSLDHLTVAAGDFEEGALGLSLNTPRRNALVVEAYTRFGLQRRALVFASTILHCKALVESFRNAGYATEYVVNEGVSPSARRDRIAAFKAGRTQILVNVGLLTEGYDDPELACLVLARPTKSALLFAQVVGRATRRADGKEDAIIIDLVDVCTTHQIENMASLLGLDPRIQFQGEDVVSTAAVIEREIVKHPQLRLNEAIAAQDLLRQAAHLELEAAPVPIVLDLPPEIRQAGGKLAWFKLAADKYLINAGGDEEYHLIGDKLHYDLVRMPGRVRLLPDAPPFDTFEEALVAAEAHLLQTNAAAYRLNLQNARWKEKEPTPAQKAYLDRIQMNHPGLTRGDASRLIEQQRIQRNGAPATEPQQRLLKRSGRWVAGMTKAAASQAITAYFSEPADPEQEAALRATGRWQAGLTRGQARDRLSKPAPAPAPPRPGAG